MCTTPPQPRLQLLDPETDAKLYALKVPPSFDVFERSYFESRVRLAHFTQTVNCETRVRILTSLIRSQAKTQGNHQALWWATELAAARWTLNGLGVSKQRADLVRTRACMDVRAWYAYGAGSSTFTETHTN